MTMTITDVTYSSTHADSAYSSCPRCERVVPRDVDLACQHCWERDGVAVKMDLLMLPIGPSLNGHGRTPQLQPVAA